MTVCTLGCHLADTFIQSYNKDSSSEIEDLAYGHMVVARSLCFACKQSWLLFCLWAGLYESDYTY